MELAEGRGSVLLGVSSLIENFRNFSEISRTDTWLASARDDIVLKSSVESELSTWGNVAVIASVALGTGVVLRHYSLGYT